MKLNWMCKIFGHKWRPVYISGWVTHITYTNYVKFIGCECSRCLYGNSNLLDMIGKMKAIKMNTYNKKYFGGDSQ